MSLTRVALACLAALTLAATAADAYFTAGVAPGGAGAAVADILPQGNVPSVTVSGSSATVSWSQNTAGGQSLGGYPGGGYTISRYPAAGGSAVVAGGTCGSPVSGTAATLTCTDSPPSGSWTYTVTPVLNNWNGAESGHSGAISAVGTAAKLVFTRQPSNGAAGTALATQPQVTVQDAAGNTVTTDTGRTIALSIATNPGGGTLSGCAQSETAGVISFSGCKIDKTATGYTLSASANGLSGATSAAFAISPGPATQLAFTTQPGGTITAGTAFPTQPVVTAQDSYGNTATSYAGTVAVTIKSGTGATGATLAGCSATLSGGVSTFSGCRIDKSGSGYVLHASDGTLGADSGAFTVLGGTATQLVLTPASTLVSAGSADNLTITAKDAFGNVATTYSGDKSLTFSGAGASPNATAAKVTDKNGAAVSFGAPTTVTFAAGVASVSSPSNGVMTLYRAGSTSIAVSDGTINSSASPVTVFVNSAGVTLGYSQACPLTVPKNGMLNLSVAIPNDAYGNAFTSQAAVGLGLAITNTTNFGFATVGQATATLSVTSGPSGNAFSIAENGGNNKTAALTMPTVPAGFTAPATCTVNSSG